MSEDTFIGESLNKRLSDIQKKLKAPKNQYNKFASFYYRSCEDILESVKPLLDDLTLRLEDTVVNVGQRYYVQARAILSDGKTAIVTTAYAREASEKTGMDAAQITGAASSYARKYALNGLFAIDDEKDADTQRNGVTKTTATKKAPARTTKTTTAKKTTKAPVKQAPERICSVEGCGESLTPRVYEYSTKNFGKPLCVAHQARERASANAKNEMLRLRKEALSTNVCTGKEAKRENLSFTNHYNKTFARK